MFIFFKSLFSICNNVIITEPHLNRGVKRFSLVNGSVMPGPCTPQHSASSKEGAWCEQEEVN